VPTAGERTKQDILTDQDKAENWRLEQLLEAGVRRTTAERLSKTDSDLHQIIEAKRAGATDVQLRKIFG